MGYQLGNGQASGSDDKTLFASATIIVTTNGDAVDVRNGCLALTLDVTAASGTTPTLDVAIQTRKDSSDSWRAIASFTQKTTTGSERKCFAGCDRQVRAVLTVGGTTPSFTCSVVGDSL